MNDFLLHLYFTAWAMRNAQISADNTFIVIKDGIIDESNTMTIDQLYDWFIDNVINGSPVIVEWPETQLLMDMPWFNECVPITSDDDQCSINQASYKVPQLNYYKFMFPLSVDKSPNSNTE